MSSLKTCEIYVKTDKEIRISPLVRAWKVLWYACEFYYNRWKQIVITFRINWQKNDQQSIFYNIIERLWNLNKHRYRDIDFNTG